MDPVFVWVTQGFTTAVSLWSLKVEGILWSGIDVFLVFGFLKIFGLARRRQSQRPIVIRFLLLWVSAVLTPLLLFTKTHGAFLLLDFVIINLHLAILVYTSVVDGRCALTMLRATLRRFAHD